jgi:hypothetical protein
MSLLKKSLMLRVELVAVVNMKEKYIVKKLEKRCHAQGASLRW